MDVAGGPSSASLAARLGGRQTIGLGGSEGQRWAGSGETSTFRSVSRLRTPGSPRTAGTALGRFVRSPPETEIVDGKDLKSLVLDVTVMLELRPRLRWDWGVPAVCRSEGDFCGCWPETV